MSESRTLIDRLITRFQSAGARQVINDTEAITKAREKLIGLNLREASSTSKNSKAEQTLSAHRASAVKHIDAAASAMRREVSTAEQVSAALTTAAHALKRAEQAEKALRGETNKNSKASKDWKRNLGELRTTLTEMNSGLELGKKALGAFGSVAGAAFDGLVSKPLELATGFETGLAKIRTLGIDTSKGLESDLLALAKRVPQTAGDITAAAFDAISAQPNKSLKEIVSLLDSASKVATGGSITLQEATNALTASTNALGSQNLTAARSADVLFATMKQGVFTIGDLQKAQGSSLGVAAALGVQYEEIGATVATLTAKGIPSAAEAFTRLDSVMNLLAKPTRQQRKAFEELGLEVGVANLKSKGFTGVLEEIRSKTGGTAEALSKLTGRNKEAFQALAAIFNDGLFKYRDSLGKITADVGAADLAFGELDNTVRGQFDRLSAEFEGLLIQVGKSLLPLIRDGIRDLQAAIGGDNGQALVGMVQQLAKGLLSAAKAVTRLVKSLADAFSDSLIGRQLKARLAAEDYYEVVQRIADEQTRSSVIATTWWAALEGAKTTAALTSSTDILGDAIGGVEAQVESLSAGLSSARGFLESAAGGSDMLGRLLFAASPAAYNLAQAIDTISTSMVEYVSVSDIFSTATSGLDAIFDAAAKRKPRKPRRGPRVQVDVELDATSLEEGRRQIEASLQALGVALDPIFEREREKYTQVIADTFMPVGEAFSAGLQVIVDGVDFGALAESASMAFAQMVDEADALTALEDALSSTQSSINALTDGISKGLSAALVDAIVFGASFEQVINQLANAVARQALIQAPLEIGYAIADQAKFLSTGLPNFQAAAAAHVAAAKTFAIIGGGALIAAAATGGIGNKGQGGRGGSARSPTSRDFGARAGGRSSSTTTNTTIINNYGPNLATRRDQESQVAAMHASNSQRRGARRIRSAA